MRPHHSCLVLLILMMLLLSQSSSVNCSRALRSAASNNKSTFREAIHAGVRFFSMLFSSSSSSAASASVKDRVLVREEMYPLASGPSRKGSGH
ncbi:hypothetical protein ACOSP7_023226 [Xanthoceras sorbifolium]